MELAKKLSRKLTIYMIGGYLTIKQTVWWLIFGL
jgi:hypothetical protein